MKFFLENRGRAGIILAIVIILAPILGTWRSVTVQAGRVEKEFTRADKFGESVSKAVKDLAYHGEAFAAAYEAILEKDDNSAALRRAAGELEKRGDDPTALSSEYTIIQRSAGILYDRLLVSGQYKDDVRAAHMALESDLSILRKYEDYNAAAQRYNEVTAQFPASIFAKDAAVVFD